MYIRQQLRGLKSKSQGTENGKEKKGKYANSNTFEPCSVDIWLQLSSPKHMTRMQDAQRKWVNISISQQGL